MKDYCACELQRIGQKFGRGGIVYCSTCDKPVCCDAEGLGTEEGHHAAEIAHKDHFLCWRHHWARIANLAVPQSESS